MQLVYQLVANSVIMQPICFKNEELCCNALPLGVSEVLLKSLLVHVTCSSPSLANTDTEVASG